MNEKINICSMYNVQKLNMKYVQVFSDLWEYFIGILLGAFEG